MKRRSHLILITLFFIVASSPAFFAQTPWQQVTESEAGFSISFPGQPTYQTSTSTVTGIQTEVYKFFYTGRLLRITFASLPNTVRTPAEVSKIYGEFSQKVVPTGGNLLRQQKLPDGGQQYDTVVNDGKETIYGRTRLYIRDSRYYAVTFEMYARDGLNEREAEHFLSSFRFLAVSPRSNPAKRKNPPRKVDSGKPVAAKWHSFRPPNGAFTVEFPGKPTYKLDSSSGATTSLHRYYYFYGENIFQVSYRESLEAVTQPEQALRRAVEIYTAPLEGRRVLRQERLPDDGYLVESRGVADRAPFYSRTRLYVRGSRVYYVTILTQNMAGPNTSDAARFLNSFRLF